MNDLEIDPDAVKALSRVDRLGSLTPKQVVVSELLTMLAWHIYDPAIPEGIDAALRLQLRNSVTSRQLLWVGFVPPESVEPLQALFGTDSRGGQILRPIGPSFIPGKVGSIREMLDSELAQTPNLPHVPVALSPSARCQSWAEGTPRQKQFLRAAFDGVDSVTVSSHNYAALRKCDAKIIPSSRFYRALRSPQFWAYTVVFVYSSLRALPLMFVRNFHGSVALIWIMDIVTAIPYTWGLLAFFTHRRRLIRYLGLLVTVVTFIAPYVYFWTHGKNYSPGVIAVVLAMILGAIGYETLNYLRDRFVTRGLSTGSGRAGS